MQSVEVKTCLNNKRQPGKCNMIGLTEGQTDRRTIQTVVCCPYEWNAFSRNTYSPNTPRCFLSIKWKRSWRIVMWWETELTQMT